MKKIIYRCIFVFILIFLLYLVIPIYPKINFQFIENQIHENWKIKINNEQINDLQKNDSILYLDFHHAGNDFGYHSSIHLLTLEEYPKFYIDNITFQTEKITFPVKINRWYDIDLNKEFYSDGENEITYYSFFQMELKDFYIYLNKLKKYYKEIDLTFPMKVTINYSLDGINFIQQDIDYDVDVCKGRYMGNTLIHSIFSAM